MYTEKHIQTGESGKRYNLKGLWHGTVSLEPFEAFDRRGLGAHIGARLITRQRPFDDLTALKHECATRLVLPLTYLDVTMAEPRRNFSILELSNFRTSSHLARRPTNELMH